MTPRPETEQTLAGDGPTQPTALPVTARIDRYEILSELGRGGMGVVYKARQVDLDRVVALKVMVAGEHASEVALARFQREAHSAARLTHPNIVPVFDVGSDGPRHWFTMRYVEGRSLSSLSSAGEVPPRRAMELTRKIALALAYAHGQGIVHRDVKPANILVDAAGEPYLADFGLAKEMEVTGLTATGTAIGTPTYASPEQVLGESGVVGPLSDVYSLGATLYEMLTGRAPFKGDGAFSIITKVIGEEPEAPRAINPRIHPDLETICLKAMEKDPRRRYASAQGLADDVGRFLDGEPILARRLSWHGKVLRKVRRNPLVAGMTAALVVALCAVAVFGVAGQARERRARADRERLVADYARELTRSGMAFVDASLACRRVADLKRSRSYAERLREPIARLKEVAPWLPEPWYHEGRMLRALGRESEAEHAQDRAVELAAAQAPTRCLALYERGVLRTRRFLDERRGAFERLTRARAAQDATFMRPTASEAEASAPGIRAVREGATSDLTEAIAWLQSDRPLPDIEATDRRARLLAAQGLLAMLEGRDGRQPLEEALSIDPSLQEAFTALAGIAQGRGDHEEAARCLERATRADRGYLPYWIGLASCLRAASNDLEAVGGDGSVHRARGAAALDEALGIDPADGDVLRQKADLLVSEGDAKRRRGKDAALDFAEALEAAERAVQADPARVLFLVMLADVHARLGDWTKSRGEDPRAEYDLAEAGYAKALGLEPENLSALANRAIVWQSVGDWMAGRGLDPLEAYGKALQGLDEALRVAPLADESANNRGIVHQSMAAWKLRHGEDPAGEIGEATAAFERALEINPRSGTAASNLGTMHLMVAREEERRGKEIEELCRKATEAYERALSINPRHAMAIMNIAVVHQLLGGSQARRGQDPTEEYRLAVDEYRKALDVNPGLAEAANNMCVSLRCLAEIEAGRGRDPSGLYEEALEACARALAINPTALDANSNLGVVHQSRAKWRADHGVDPTADIEESLAAFDRSLAANPRFPDAASNKSIVLAMRGQWKAAHGQDPAPDYQLGIEAIEAALAINPGFVEAFANRANLYKLLGDVKAQRGEDPSGEYAEAVKGYERALESDPRNFPSTFNLALIRQLAGDGKAKRGLSPIEDYEKAIAALDKAISLAPSTAPAHMQRGLMRKLIGDWKRRAGQDPAEDYDAAMEGYDHALELNAELWQAHVNRAEILKRRGSPREALEALERAQAIVGDGFPPLKRWIAEARAALEKK
ncbi:MAG: protein kinase [Planctomycetota bacterium]